MRKLTALRSWAKWTGDPTFLGDYRAPTPARAEPHPIPEGIDGVLLMMGQTMRRDRRALVALCGLCGLRVNEACGVRPEHVNIDERTIKVRGKGDRERIVRVGEAAWQAIMPAYEKAIERGTTLVVVKNRQARTIITKLAARASLTRRVASHDLRATFATRVLENTGDLRAAQEALGHASSKQTEVYTGVSAERARRAAEVV